MSSANDDAKVDQDVLDILEKETKEHDKDQEIDRILNEFRLNAYAVLDLQPGVPESDIIKTYRKKSLLIHPDKTKNPKAPDAFDRLKKAHSELTDEKTRERLDEAIADARMLLIREKKWNVNDNSEDLQTDEFKEEWKEKVKWVLMDNEKRRMRQVKAQMQEEGRQQRKEEEELNERKRKREYEQKWEQTREERVGSWRDFQHKKAQSEAVKAKKKKLKPLA